MALTSKQRAYLRSLANTLPTILYIGKDGVTPATCKSAYDALEARELIKCSVQSNAPYDAREACTLLCEQVHADPVQCIGGRFTIYRRNNDEPVIVLPQ